MGSIEQTEFHIFIGCHVIGKFNPDPFPGRATGDEFVFDHPLYEVFAIYRSVIICPVHSIQPGYIIRAGGRRNPIDHTVGECNVFFHPYSQISILCFYKGHE